MAQLVVRDIENDVKENLQRRAKEHGHSMEAEVRDILRRVVSGPDKPSIPLGTSLARRFSEIGLDQPILELRGQDAAPADVDG